MEADVKSAKSHCFWHSNDNEMLTEESYKQCKACRHVFQTEAELRESALGLTYVEADDNGAPIEGFEKPIWPADTPVEGITFCPLCGVGFNDQC